MDITLMTTKQREPHPTCADRVHSNLKDREEQLRDGELEGLCFDYVAPHSFTDQVEGAHVVLDKKKNARMWNELCIMCEAS